VQVALFGALGAKDGRAGVAPIDDVIDARFRFETKSPCHAATMGGGNGEGSSASLLFCKQVNEPQAPNPGPFGSVVREDFWTETSNKQLNFLQHIFTLLMIDGRATVVLPDNVLFEGGAGEKVRKNLLEKCNVPTVRPKSPSKSQELRRGGGRVYASIRPPRVSPGLRPPLRS
jgi:hypothetical protein